MPARDDDTVSSSRHTIVYRGLYVQRKRRCDASRRGSRLLHRHLPPGAAVFVCGWGLVCLHHCRTGFPTGGTIVRPVSLDPDGLLRSALQTFIQPYGAMVKKKEVKAIPGGPAASSEGLSKLVSLAEWMTSTSYEDGTPRQVPTVTFWCQAGEWKANLRDRAEGLCLWLSAGSWGELVKMIDAACQDSSYPWRRDEYGDPEKGKRVRRAGQ